MPDRDRRGGKPGAPKPDVPWLKDRPDLHRTEDTDVLSDESPAPAPTQDAAPSKAEERPANGGAAQRVPGSERRGGGAQSGEPGAQGDATKARRRPS